jgi:hypothetical protein
MYIIEIYVTVQEILHRASLYAPEMTEGIYESHT